MADSPTPSKMILLFGGTGLIGRYILASLVSANPPFEKIAIFTSPDTAENKSADIAKLKEKGVQVVIGHVNSEEDVKKAFEGYDTVISALGRNVILLQNSLLTLAESSPTIHTFYPSEYGTDIEYAPSSAHEKPHQLKLQVRKHIKENIRKLNVTYLVTGPYSDLFIQELDGDMAAAGSFDVKANKATLVGDGEGKVSFTTMHDVGQLLVASLRTPFPHSSSSSSSPSSPSSSSSPRILKVNSFTTTPTAILSEFEKQTGTKWDVSYTPLDELKKAEKEAWEAKNPMATRWTLRRIWAEGGTLYEERDNGKIGEPETESLESQVRKAVEKGTSGFQSGAL
ncbi:NAD(P)-binding protein [Pleomassaria siparia CBS 279.74]|uniref:NAD(P)-binding protein n=1 Tax=Pleomassaria siparia CBS 279.74 TaxID=1314801 RepID=A0A6G1KP10_9PLEO|nr:NAD(P)-binding protein [Pleomassaria siparia CBS 279.74]